MRIAVFSTQPYDKEFFERFNKDGEIKLKYYDVSLNADTVDLAHGFDGVCVFVNDKLDDTTISGLSGNGVKLIALRCAGFNNVDLKAAAKYGVKVFRVPAYSPESIAEHALALILTLDRKTHKAYNRIREGNFSLVKLRGFELHGKTVGIIGTGRIGSAFARIMLGMGCRILAYDMYQSEELKKAGVNYVDLDGLFGGSDIISLHCPLTSETKHIVRKENLEKMKEGVMLINTSRGGLIKTMDAIEALKSGKIGYLGIDVYEQEKSLFYKDLSESIIPDDTIMRLIAFPNVLITAHQGFFTQEALTQITLTTLKNISDFGLGVKNGNEVILP
ncbi:MAG: 2-hydroxyacid dehydrogenase [Bacteroidales bacterium]|jgi:D-lactate dehydrogenase|nr:2-hydroxyacid dehydrogenase [Bacteroidales bacterium]